MFPTIQLLSSRLGDGPDDLSGTVWNNKAMNGIDYIVAHQFRSRTHNISSQQQGFALLLDHTLHDQHLDVFWTITGVVTNLITNPAVETHAVGDFTRCTLITSLPATSV